MLNEKRINRSQLVWWASLVAILVFGYAMSAIAWEITALYVVKFTLISALPILVGLIVYLHNPESRALRYVVVIGYFIMYAFAMITGTNAMVYTYILPLIALLILYHQASLMLWTGIVMLAMNVFQVIYFFAIGQMSLVGDNASLLIRFFVLFMVFSGSYITTYLYDKSYKENAAKQQVIEEKSEQIQRLTLQTIETIANTIDAKDEYTKGHSIRVAEYSSKIAEKLGMTHDEVLNVRYIALLHDIGKIGIPDSVLNKPGKLTDEEYEVMKTHTVIGGDILKDVDMLPGLDQGALYHHERYDGRGYPHGLKGEEIPLIARIIGTADAYDAMSSNRVYRRHLSRDIIIDEIKRCSGTQFDPKIAAVFLDYLENEADWGKIEEEDVHSLADESSKLLQKVVEERSMQAQVDELTGTYHRAYAERHVADKMREGFGCMIMANLDNMRYINRKFGFHRGDAYLVTLAKLLKESSDDAVVSRFGGDEFLCYVPGMQDEDDIRACMDHLMESVKNLRESDELLGQLSVSAGISVYDRKGIDYQTLLQQADKALYHIKQDTKDGYYFYRQVEDMDDLFTRADLNSLLQEVYRKDNYSKETVLSHKEFFKVYDFVYDMIKEYSADLRLILFTARFKNEALIGVEERDGVMRMVENAIRNVMQEENAFTRYSSIQRVVVVVGEESGHAEEIAQNVSAEFAKIYGKDDVELASDIASVRD